MALNLDKIRNRLSSFDKTKKGGKKAPTEQQEKIKKYIWKPEPGKQVVRIVPSQFSPDDPFFVLKWHYDFNGDKVSYLSPASQNQADPIVELASRLEPSHRGAGARLHGATVRTFETKASCRDAQDPPPRSR